MEVILKEDVPKLGSRGDVVKVAEGFGRNYLLPHKLAIEASKGNKAVIEQMKAAAVRRSAKEKTGAEALAKQFEGVSVSFTAALGRERSALRFSHFRRYRGRAGEEGLRRGPPQDSDPRAAQDRGRIHRADQAAQGRDHAPESGHRKRSSGVSTRLPHAF